MSSAVSDAAHVRVFASEPPLPLSASARLTSSLEKLLRQFEREGRCAAGSAWVEEAGRFVVVAWDGPALSGCSHDKIGQILQATERAHAVELLGSAPLAVGMPPQLMTRSGVRAALAAGRLTLASPWWQVRATELSRWRAGPSTVGASGLFAPATGNAG
jgi:hypothetical protein